LAHLTLPASMRPCFDCTLASIAPQNCKASLHDSRSCPANLKCGKVEPAPAQRIFHHPRSSPPTSAVRQSICSCSDALQFCSSVDARVQLKRCLIETGYVRCANAQLLVAPIVTLKLVQKQGSLMRVLRQLAKAPQKFSPGPLRALRSSRLLPFAKPTKNGAPQDRPGDQSFSQ